ncbi:hypothetical protein [Streptomyces sp. NPDC020141]|uniref:hypothetical protein n=1 Tax=Streptomyces sp. NPDC020141 TaxID=3365065 RepID=UPI0037896677
MSWRDALRRQTAEELEQARQRAAAARDASVDAYASWQHTADQVEAHLDAAVTHIEKTASWSSRRRGR